MLIFKGLGVIELEMKNKKTVCVLEDDKDIREIIEFLLESENYKVFTYASVESFKSGASKQNADAYILDVMLPDGNGLEVCRGLKSDSLTKSTPVLMMSANYSTEDVSSNCTAQDFIKKPFDIGDFVSRLDAQISGHAQNIPAFKNNFR